MDLTRRAANPRRNCETRSRWTNVPVTDRPGERLPAVRAMKRETTTHDGVEFGELRRSNDDRVRLDDGTVRPTDHGHENRDRADELSNR